MFHFWTILGIITTIVSADLVLLERALGFCTNTKVVSVLVALSANAGGAFCTGFIGVSTQTSTITTTVPGRILLVHATDTSGTTTSIGTTTTATFLTTMLTTFTTLAAENLLGRRGLAKRTLPVYLQTFSTSAISEGCSCFVATPTTTVTVVVFATGAVTTTTTTTTSTVTDVTTQEISTTMAVAETATYQQVASTNAFGCAYEGIPDMNSGDYYAYVPTTNFDVAVDSCLQTCARYPGCQTILLIVPSTSIIVLGLLTYSTWTYSYAIMKSLLVILQIISLLR